VQQQIPFGDDKQERQQQRRRQRQKSKDNDNGVVVFYHPTLRDETAKDGAPGLLWMGEEDRGRSRSPSGMTTRKASAKEHKSRNNSKGKSKGSH
jgi:hypothetical protein